MDRYVRKARSDDKMENKIDKIMEGICLFDELNLGDIEVWKSPGMRLSDENDENGR
jgi:hypothetical protein